MPSPSPDISSGSRNQALIASTAAFTACFAVWLLFSIIGVRIKENLDLTETQFGLLVATPVLTGSVSRLFLGIWAEMYGGRAVFVLQMILTAVAVWLLASATTYPMFIVAALGLGLAGGSFIVGVSYVSKWYPREKQGTALGVFGAGSVGAAVTNFGAPFLLVAYGWEQTVRIYAVALMAVAFLFWLVTKPDPVTLERRRAGIKPPSLMEQLRPLARMQVWRFSFYYFVTFGAFVALASWLPRYYVAVYDADIKTAGMMAALFSLPAAVFRAFGGWLADRHGARHVMYATFLPCIVCSFFLSYPPTSYVVQGIKGPIAFSYSTGMLQFAVLMMILGFFMSLGMAATYKHIPVYYPENVGSVGGLVGMLGGLGGFFLPIAFGFLNDHVNVWTSCFMLLYGLMVTAFAWMHVVIRRMERRRIPELRELGRQLELRESGYGFHEMKKDLS
jgi:NNP family nitrate/nitrite transporter-like MFS transporter